MTENYPQDASKLIRQIEKAEQELIEKRSNQGDEEDGIAVLFTGNWHTAIPRHLLVDQLLSPVEKLTWCAIRLSITDPSRPGATPRREELATMVNCSAPTITVSRTMLRASRWMTFCKSVRKQGRFVGDIYLFNDDPLSLESTLNIDSSYIPFLQQQAQSNSKRLRTVASAILREIDSLQNINKPTELDQLSRRISRFSFIAPENTQTDHQRKNLSLVNNDFFNAETTSQTDALAATGYQSKDFTTDEAQAIKISGIHGKNFTLAENNHSNFFSPVKNFFPLVRGSNSNNSINNKYITAREEDIKSAKNANNENGDPLTKFENFNADYDPEKTFILAIKEFPELASLEIKRYVIETFGWSKENQLPIIKRIISKLPEPNRTYVLLQLIGRNAADFHGWTNTRLHNAISFTKVLVDKALKDEFFPDEWALGLETAIKTRNSPMFFDSPEKMRRLRNMSAQASDGESKSSDSV